jgi:hypothetical protein
MTKDNNAKAVIKQLLANTEELLNANYQGAFALREKDKVRIAFQHDIEHNEYGELIATSKLKYGKRVTAEIEHTVDTGQLALDLQKNGS